MRRYVYGRFGLGLVRVEEAEPECGEDFCDRCGDCLVCHGSEDCFFAFASDPDASHLWVEYDDEAEEA